MSGQKMIITPAKIAHVAVLSCGLVCLNQPAIAGHPSKQTADVVIYGCTPAGITAAMELRRHKKSVTLLCPEKHIGGMSANGLGYADTGNHAAVGGMARRFYVAVRNHYKSIGYSGRMNSQSATAATDASAMYVFEPHVAEKIYDSWLRQYGVKPVRSVHLSPFETGVTRRGNRITSIKLSNGKTYRGRIFIDATYEGDLLAAAGVSYATGREANSQYDETLNGVQTAQANHHQFDYDVDPYIVKGDPSSGLLPNIEPTAPGPDGSADDRVQAYTYRLCMTKVAANRAPFPKPANYDAKAYELLGRYLDAGWRQLFNKYDAIPDGKTDTNNHGAFSLDGIGLNSGYPNGSYAEREVLKRQQRDYEEGLLWFMQNDPRSPADVQAAMKDWGLCADEFADNDHWPHEIYVREARRMVSDFVMTERNLTGALATPEPVGMGAYTIDSHNVRRYVDARGFARNEGNVEVPLSKPYTISYLSLVPRRSEARNLIVPVAVSASHIAYGSIRMEPVFMILGQSSGAAASLALDRHVDVQDVPYAALRRRLLAEGQILTLDAR